MFAYIQEARMWKGIISTYSGASIETDPSSMASWSRSGTTCTLTAQELTADMQRTLTLT